MPFHYMPSEVRRKAVGKGEQAIVGDREDGETLLFHFTFITETVEY